MHVVAQRNYRPLMAASDMREAKPMTEAEVRAALAAFDAIGGMECWIAAQPWLAAPGGWVVPEPFHGLRFRVEPVTRGVRVRAFADKGEPAAWIVPAR